jgi:haloalkane dehalogenase
LVEVGHGEQLSVFDVGSGPVVLFSHGTPTWAYEWRHLLRALSTRFRCIAPDHLGFGTSPRPIDGDYRPEAHARRFSALVDRLGLDRYHLIVHDFGGPFALHEAVSRPQRVRSLTAFNTFAWAFGDSPRTRRMARLAGSALFRWAYGALNLSFKISRSAWGDRATMTPSTWRPYEELFADAESRRLVLWALAKAMQGSAEFCEAIWNRLPGLRSTPVQLIWGLADSAFPPSALAKLRTALPHAQVLELPSAGHWPHEEQPERCVAAVTAFLESVG